MYEAEQSIDHAENRMIPVSTIDTNPYQPRRIFHEVALQELVASILEHGILQPVIVRPHGNRYQLVSGERRLTAARRASLTHVPALVREYDDLQMLEISIVENIQREDITPLEAAAAYKRLMEEFHLTQEQVALKLGKSRPAVANTLRLLNLPSNIMESLSRGDITEGHARSLLAVDDPEWQQRVWRRIVEDNLSVRDTETLSRGASTEAVDETSGEDEVVSRETRPRRRKRRQTDPNLAAVEERLRRLLGTRVRISGRPDTGAITIEYYSTEDLERIASLLGLV